MGPDPRRLVSFHKGIFLPGNPNNRQQTLGSWERSREQTLPSQPSEATNPADTLTFNFQPPEQ